MFLKFFLWYDTVTLSSLSRILEKSRGNLNSQFDFSKDPVHWVEAFLKNQTFINVLLQNTRNILRNYF